MQIENKDTEISIAQHHTFKDEYQPFEYCEWDHVKKKYRQISNEEDKST